MNRLLLVFSAAWIVAGVPAQAEIERKQIRFPWLEEQAAEAAKKEFKPVEDERELPDNLRGVTYDQYRKIKFRYEKQLWNQEGVNYRMSFFHLGYLFKQPVEIFEFSGDYCQSIRFSRDFFDYADSKIEGALPPDLGFAGFRIGYPLNAPDDFSEIGVFQGASYFRMIGKNQHFGLSARGLALNAGIDGVKEEFPVFTHFWAGKPQPGSTSLTLFALLNSPSVAGAYQFVISPGDQTVAQVKATLYFRKPVEHIGIAPLTSMFWFGENTTRPFDDYRPEVHDSDGLVIKAGNGECLWRPLRNDPGRNRTYVLSFDQMKGFGLAQRDRNPRSYEDFEAGYHIRPGVWIEPEGDWGAGSIRLVELATKHELSDNIVVGWEPKTPPVVGEPYRIAYKQSWTTQPNPAGAAGWVVNSRSGTHEWAPDTRYVVLEFAGPALAALPKETGAEGEVKLEAEVSVNGANVVLAGPARVQKVPGSDTYRVAFEIKKTAKDAKVDGAELRCSLKKGADYLSETWTGWLPL